MIALVLLLSAPGMSAQQDIGRRSWNSVATKMPVEWYGSTQAVQIADTLVRYQTVKGGWPKNVKWHIKVDRDEMRRIQETGIGATIDNNATTTEMRYIAKVYARTGEERFRLSFLRGVGYLLEAQYDNGGWPQFYPVRPQKSVSYSGHITYNDGAMVNVMNFLRDIYDSSPDFAALAIDDSTKAKAREAFDRGISCILKTQIISDGVPTVWCAQHDAVTLLPAKARAYELPSFSGSESAGVVWLLMSLPDPSPEVIRAVKGAVSWFESHRIDNRRFVRRRDETGRRNATLTEAEGECVWARFYDLETGEPFVCDRDGIKRKSLDELGAERRNGYAWYVTAPAGVVKAYPKWLEKHDL